jgi:hypothetical protein
MTERAERISVDHLTQAAFSGVLRALEERGLEPAQFPGPILVGIIAWPELSTKALHLNVPTQG